MAEMTKTGFRPVQGTEESILATPYSEGWVYFATDSGKIFLDAENNRMVMGGSGASLFYANAISVRENPEGTYTLPYDSLDDSTAAPVEDDLIINTLNGCFYRVLSADEEMGIECTLLAVSGTGSGGGGDIGGGGDSGGSGSGIILELIDSSFPTTFVHNQDAFVNFKATATDDTLITVTVKVVGSSTVTESYTQYSGQEFAINIGKLLLAGTNKITVTASGENSGSATKSYSNRSCITLGLQKNASFNPLQVFSGACTFSCIPIGAGLEKTLKVNVDGMQCASAVIGPTISNRTYTIDIPEQTHGAHEVEIFLTTSSMGMEMRTESLKYELAWKEEGNTTPIVWIPEGYVDKIVNYTEAKVDFMVYDPENETTEVRFYRESVELPTSPQNLTYSSTKYLTWNLTDYEVGTNLYTIAAGSYSKPFSLVVEEDTSRNMNILTSGLILNLDATGRSNNENETSRQTWKHTNIDGITTSVSFNNFNWYNNGWVSDANGQSCLRISNGASISIPVAPLNVLNSTSLANPLAFEFRFKVRNVNEYATLVKRGSDADSTDNVEGYETERGVFGKLFSTSGFCLGTQEAFFKASNVGVSARYREDDIVNLTFVLENRTASNAYPLIYIYLNGVMSGITTYTSSESFESNAINLVFNSDYCDVDLYKIRIYKSSFSSADVVHNYIADTKDVQAYDMNQIVSYDENSLPYIDYELMYEYNVQHPAAPLMPYAIVKTLDKDDMLPYVKGGKKAVNVKFVNPTLDYLYENELITGEQYLLGCPSYELTDVSEKIIDVQGTSSQGYPRRNYKIKCGDTDGTWVYTNGPLAGQSLLDDIDYNGKTYNKWYMDREIGESTFCWKADYMDSSRVHNSGFASYVSTLYSKHPLSDYGINAGDARTTIYGFPMIVFQEMQDGSIKFVGMYNYNTDKGCKATVGFTASGNSKVPSYTEATEFASGLYEKIDGNYVVTTDTSAAEGKTYYTKGYKAMKKVAECWELCNNQGTYCSFQTDDFDTTVDTYTEKLLSALTYTPGVYYTTEDEGVTYQLAEGEYDANATYFERVIGPLEVNNHFEYRYHADDDDIDDCLEGKGNFASMSQTERNAYMNSKYKNFKRMISWLISTRDDLNKFKAEFTQHFDAEYCYVYFIMTELLHLYDSRGKNCMMATWGPKVEGGEYIWYPIFYDIDTQLGINNSGVPTWDYFAEPTDGNSFSTSNSILWNNLWACFSDEIKAKYISMRKDNLDITHLDGFYNFDPEVTGSYAMRGKRPIVLHNLDEYYKYIAPTKSGFINTSGDTVYDTGSFFYCLQGTRELLRYLYLRNRLNYVDSKWNGGAYATEAAKNEFWGRMDASNGAATSDKFLYEPGKTGTFVKDGVTYEYTDTYPVPLDATPNFNVRSFLKQYIHGQYDDVHTPVVYCDGVDSVAINANAMLQEQFKKTPALTQQLIYFGGGQYIADMGDLGLKYLDELKIPTLKRLESLKVGSDIEGYYNDQLFSNNFSIAANAKNADGTPNENAKTLLKEVVLTGLRQLSGTIDISGSEKLEIFRALNTQISAVEFADGVQLKTLHLPNSITTLSLIEPTSLTGTVATPGAIGAFNEGLYIEGLTDKVGTTIANGTEVKLTTINIIGGNMSYGSFKLLNTLVDIKKKMQSAASISDGYSKQLSINLENVNWSPYEKVEYGEPYDSRITYYFDGGRYTLTTYTYSSTEQWEADTLNGKVYTYNGTLFSKEAYTITTLDMLDTFINSYENAMIEFNATGSKELNYFRSTSAVATTPTLPVLTGIIYVNNTVAYEEADIQNKYLAAFPGLTIFCTNINEGYTATFVSVTDGKEESIEVQRYRKDDADARPVIPAKTPTKLNYTFLGWSLRDGGTVLTEEEFETLTFSSTNTAYKFYAIYKVTTYDITFYNADETVLFEDKKDYGEYLESPALLPSVDESKLTETQRYRFAGWVTDIENCYQKSASTAANVVVNLSKIISQNMDRKFYACYYIEDVYTVSTPDEYFDFIDYTWNDPIDASHSSAAGYLIAPASGYELAGKITLPSTHNNKPVVGIRGFNNQDKITHIYWKGSSQCKRIDNNAFTNCYGLKYFQFPDTVRYIGMYAFQSCSMLQPFDFSNNNTIYYIGQGAFNSAFFASSCPVFVIPGSVTTLGGTALSYNAGLAGGIGTLQIGSQGHGSLLDSIGTNAVIQNTGSKVHNLVIYVEDELNVPEVIQKALQDGKFEYTGELSIVQA